MNILGLTRQHKIAWKSGRKFILKFSPQADFNFVQPWSQGSHSSETWTQYDVQPTQCKTNFQVDTAKHLEKIWKTLQRQRPDSDETQTSCVPGWELY